ncbi:MAG: lysine--tRNA ligase [Cellvibrionales bacterium TMED148]|nr:lysine--tRNA ligase [Porticoccaceae bacterium]RPG90100.1 MAG: lysine--tRNA ligase [Cellvibrionales bacterium TMED148]
MTEQQDFNRLVSERRRKLKDLRQQSDFTFPNDFRPEHSAGHLQSEFSDVSKSDLERRHLIVSVAGRIIRNRGAFVVLQDSSASIQLYVTKLAREFVKSLDLGDIIGTVGSLQRSNKGDLFIQMGEWRLLTKSLRPLPDKFHGLADQELRYRQRYVDLIVNPGARDTFRLRSEIISFLRGYLNAINFLEVETPMLQVIPGGAVARPFVTHHNALDIDMYLRVAPELYLKRLVVGGFERVYEINRNFRNEGLSTRHNPEFTMLEFYQAYADYEDAMKLTEDMLRRLTNSVLGSTKVINTRGGEEKGDHRKLVIDFGKPFARFSMFDSIVHYNLAIAPDNLSRLDPARELALSLGIGVKESWGLGKLQLAIFEKTVESKLEQPTFITQYPAEVSPLSRRNDSDPSLTDRFELFIGGREIANGFSELNDPEDQAERFKHQVSERNEGDDEAMHFDEDYIRALEYGMPPAVGEGIGIDRLVMILTNSRSIRDVLLFPHMRPE